MVTMEELLASQNKKFTTLNRGQEVEGEIVSITDREVILEIGAKSEGVLPKKELAQKEIKIGDKIKAFVQLPENESGQVALSIYSAQPKFSSRGKTSWTKFIQAQNQKNKLRSKVIEVNKGGLIVEVEGTRGFLPNSQVGYDALSKSGKGMEELVGADLVVSVIEVDQENNKLIFSQRGQVSDEVKNKLKEFKNGQKLTGKIVAILPFGLVVDIDGVEGLVFISDVSWERQEDLTKLYSVGDEVEVMVVGLDEELGRLNLSIKQLSEDPFLQIAQNYPPDEVVKGEITGVSEAGVTVALEQAEGFLPSSKMEQGTTYEVGKSMSFLVDEVDSNRRRVDLAPFVTSTEGLIYK